MYMMVEKGKDLSLQFILNSISFSSLTLFSFLTHFN